MSITLPGMHIDGELASHGGQPGLVAEVLRRSPPVMAALRAAREVAAPDWFISAGAIRDAVWDGLNDRPPTAKPRDVDFSFFDSADLTPEHDTAVEAALGRWAPGLPWEAKNQAAVHLWYPARFGLVVPPFTCCAEAIGTFPETASCVGVRLLEDDDLLVVAPHGLDDLLNGVCRHNPTRVSVRFYAERQAAKAWPRRWPRVRFRVDNAAPALYHVRRATVVDAHAIDVVRQRAIRVSAAGFYGVEALEAWALGSSARKLRRKIEATAGFVAVADGRVIGWANLDGDEIDQLYVDPDYGGRGVARGLFEALEALASTRGVRKLTAVASLRAAPVFRRFGFTETCQDERWYDGHLFRVADMVKPLAVSP